MYKSKKINFQEVKDLHWLLEYLMELVNSKVPQELMEQLGSVLAVVPETR